MNIGQRVTTQFETFKFKIKEKDQCKIKLQVKITKIKQNKNLIHREVEER